MNPTPFIPLEESPHCECGVFGVFAPGMDVARLAYFGLFALQHRGQESAGIAVTDGRALTMHKGMGLVSQIFDEETLAGLRGHAAIGHNRYSTTGSSVIENAQPILSDSPEGPLAIGHNGNLVNTLELFSELSAAGVRMNSTNDTELLGRIIAQQRNVTIEQATLLMMDRCLGAYSLVMLAKNKLLGVRDPHGVRPLCLGQLDGKGYVLASETCAFNVIGAKFVRELQPGEVLVIDETGLRTFQHPRPEHSKFCIFEYVYLARPDSYLYDRSVHATRRRMGNLLAQEHAVQADIVIGVPLTGIPAAIGFSEASRIPYGEGLIQNRYIQRTFIQPSQQQRDLGVRMKLTPLREALAGKRVVVVEDSIVRGTTTRAIVGMIREAGAREVHMRISSPPYAWPCFYGIDTPNREELMASSRTPEQIGEYIGADSLGYLSLNNLVKAVGLPKHSFCRACFDGKYPIEVPHAMKLTKHALESEV